MQFVDPKNDVAFRKIFGDENKKEILISFLNNILEFAGTPKEIIDLSIADIYQLPRLSQLKETCLDIRAVDKRGIHYIVEMQLFRTEALEKRILYYVSKAYSQQLNKAEEYPKLDQVIFLGFTNFDFFADHSHYFSRHLILEENSKENYFKDFILNFVELPKFKATLQELQGVKEKWIYFMKHAGDMTMIPAELEEPRELKEAFEVANLMSWTREELDTYDYLSMMTQDERGRIEYAAKEGKEEGRKEGRKEGLVEGMEKGEKKKTAEMALKMKDKGFSIEDIAGITGLSTAEIEKL